MLIITLSLMLMFYMHTKYGEYKSGSVFITAKSEILDLECTPKVFTLFTVLCCSLMLKWFQLTLRYQINRSSLRS